MSDRVGLFTVHPVKSWPEFFRLLITGVKWFELRRNDRDYRPGDYLHLREWDPETQTYTGRSCERKITYILQAHADPGTMTMPQPVLGLQAGYCIMQLDEPKR